MNLTEKWFEIYLDKYGSRKECIQYLNETCGMKIRESEFSEYKYGKRTPNACMQWIMRCDILIDELKAAGWKNVNRDLSADNLIVLVNAMSVGVINET